jgi:hypothetical protein
MRKARRPSPSHQVTLRNAQDVISEPGRGLKKKKKKTKKTKKKKKPTHIDDMMTSKSSGQHSGLTGRRHR